MLLWLISIVKKYKIDLCELDEILSYLKRSLELNETKKNGLQQLIKIVKKFCEKRGISRKDEENFIERIRNLWISLKDYL